MKHRIGIIGGSGFLGTSLAKYLVENFEVKILDQRPPPKSLEKIVDYSYCDVRNYSEVVEALKKIDLVIHTAIIQIPLINEQKSLGYQVNITGTQNVCMAVNESPDAKGMLLSGSWHTVGERDLKGTIDEEFGFRPDKVEDRARLYALSKIAQESIVRFYDEISDKIYGIIRMGTILGEGMPEKTAANIFIERGLKGEEITPYKHSMYRPMLYVDIGDICGAYEAYAEKILSDEIAKDHNSLAHIVNVYYPIPITIMELAEIVREAIIEHTYNEIRPEVKIVESGVAPLFTQADKNRIEVDISKAKRLLGLEKLKSPKESIQEIISQRTRKH